MTIHDDEMERIKKAFHEAKVEAAKCLSQVKKGKTGSKLMDQLDSSALTALILKSKLPTEY